MVACQFHQCAPKRGAHCSCDVGLWRRHSISGSRCVNTALSTKMRLWPLVNANHFSINPGSIQSTENLQKQKALEGNHSTTLHKTLNFSFIIEEFGGWGIRQLFGTGPIDSCLSKRSQSTQIGSTVSNKEEIVNGVPQGSVLCPRAF